jgi:hypothetical protein
MFCGKKDGSCKRMTASSNSPILYKGKEATKQKHARTYLSLSTKVLMIPDDTLLTFQEDHTAILFSTIPQQQPSTQTRTS